MLEMDSPILNPARSVPGLIVPCPSKYLRVMEPPSRHGGVCEFRFPRKYSWRFEESKQVGVVILVQVFPRVLLSFSELSFTQQYSLNNVVLITPL